MPQAARRNVSPPLAAFASWLIPGGGYWLIGQRTRAVTVGVTIVLVFAMGLLIGGVRSLEVPGWDDDGMKIRLNDRGERVLPDYGDAYTRATWILGSRRWIFELRAKPWFIAQGLAGPVALGAGAWSIWAATDPDGDDGPLDVPGAASHGRVNEIGVLYTAVAGMLNLLAMIDASHRANQAERAPGRHPGAAGTGAPPGAKPEATT